MKARLRRRLDNLIDWYDDLTDRERVGLSVVAMLVLISSVLYCLGLGSAVLVARVQAAAGSATATPEPLVATSSVALAPEAGGTATVGLAQPTLPPSSSTPVPPSATPRPDDTATPIAAPDVVIVPAIPRQPPPEPVVVPQQEPVRSSPSPTVKPRNVADTPVASGTPDGTITLPPSPGITPIVIGTINTPVPASTPQSVGTTTPPGTSQPSPAATPPPNGTPGPQATSTQAAPTQTAGPPTATPAVRLVTPGLPAATPTQAAPQAQPTQPPAPSPTPAPPTAPPAAQPTNTSIMPTRTGG